MANLDHGDPYDMVYGMGITSETVQHTIRPVTTVVHGILHIDIGILHALLTSPRTVDFEQHPERSY